MDTGTLYGIGVGPGDPELITLKAVRALQSVDVVFTAASSKNRYSIAVEIVSPHLKDGIPIVRLDFPMTRDRESLNRAWHENAEIVRKELSQGRNAALITLGDPMTYSTFGYLMRTLKEESPEYSIRVIPGITSYQAAAAAAERVLAEGEESFTVVSGALGPQKLREVVNHTDNVVMLKVYRNYREILEALSDLDLTRHSILVSRCGFDGEQVIASLADLPDEVPPYLSLLLIKKP
ncbi:MAG: precorrin-2 C(20)-methyltransferase [Desulfobacteraceae bacterium]|jgi:precorrin-2/cobalt-factor-2 C20-methyltransferase